MYAEVLIQYEVKSLDHTFTYEVPDNLKDIIQVGMKVSIPFGKKNINGFVISLTKEKPDSEYEIKDVLNVPYQFLKAQLWHSGDLVW